jgi:hypothetical protein
VVEDEDCPLLRGQAPETAVQLVALDHRFIVVGAIRLIDRQESDIGRPAATASSLPIAGMHEQASQPGVEAIDVPKRRQVTPGEQSDLDAYRR